MLVVPWSVPSRGRAKPRRGTEKALRTAGLKALFWNYTCIISSVDVHMNYLNLVMVYFHGKKMTTFFQGISIMYGVLCTIVIIYFSCTNFYLFFLK